jgi:hypothetical protein
MPVLTQTQAGYQGPALTQFSETLRTRPAAIPGVRDATLSGFPLISGAMSLTAVKDRNAAPDRNGDTAVLLAGPEFFSTMEIPILLGREIHLRDIGSTARVGRGERAFRENALRQSKPARQTFSLR